MLRGPSASGPPRHQRGHREPDLRRRLAGSATGSLTKIGAGSLQFDGAETFTGTTTVNAGAVSGTGTLAGPLVVNGPGQVAPGDNSSGYFGGAGTLTVPSATLNGGAVLDVDLGTSSDLLKVTGALTLNGGTVNVQNSGGLSTGTYEIMSYGSLTNPFNAGSLFVGNMPSGYIGHDRRAHREPNQSQRVRGDGVERRPRLGVGYQHAELDHKRQRGDLRQRQRGGVHRRGQHRQRERRRDGNTGDL